MTGKLIPIVAQSHKNFDRAGLCAFIAEENPHRCEQTHHEDQGALVSGAAFGVLMGRAVGSRLAAEGERRPFP